MANSRVKITCFDSTGEILIIIPTKLGWKAAMVLAALQIGAVVFIWLALTEPISLVWKTFTMAIGVQDEVFLLYLFIWFVVGFYQLKLTNGVLSIKRDWLGMGKVQLFEIASIQRLGIDRPVSQGSRGGTITFAPTVNFFYEGRQIWIAKGNVTEADSTAILKAIEQA